MGVLWTLFLISILLFSDSLSAKTVLEDTVNLIVDPTGFVESSENLLDATKIIEASLDRSLLLLKELQSKTDLDIRDYLNHIDTHQ